VLQLGGDRRGKSSARDRDREGSRTQRHLGESLTLVLPSLCQPGVPFLCLRLSHNIHSTPHKLVPSPRISMQLPVQKKRADRKKKHCVRRTKRLRADSWQPSEAATCLLALNYKDNTNPPSLYQNMNMEQTIKSLSNYKINTIKYEDKLLSRGTKIQS
jgi:hypothetical protein